MTEEMTQRAQHKQMEPDKRKGNVVVVEEDYVLKDLLPLLLYHFSNFFVKK